MRATSDPICGTQTTCTKEQDHIQPSHDRSSHTEHTDKSFRNVRGGISQAASQVGTLGAHEHVRVLEVKPASQWKTNDMEQAYKDLADRYGTPRAVLVDGAPELRDGAKCLANRRDDTIVLRDFKHYTANVLKSLLGKDEAFLTFLGNYGDDATHVFVVRPDGLRAYTVPVSLEEVKDAVTELRAGH